MHRIHPHYLRLLLKNRLYRTAAVRSSILGGWLVRRPAKAQP